MPLRCRSFLLCKRHAIIAFLSLAASTWGQQPASSSADAPGLPQLYSQGMAEFQAGDYAKAAADLDALITKAEFSAQLEPAFFTVGSAYFNAPDYKKAMAAFKNYQT